MAESKQTHTPGPWSLSVLAGEFAGQILGPDNSTIALTTSGIMGRRDTALANARLIAAAPEMFEALKEVADDLEKLLATRGFRDDPKVARARAALSKAGA